VLAWPFGALVRNRALFAAIAAVGAGFAICASLVLFSTPSAADDATLPVPQWAARLDTPAPAPNASADVRRGYYLALAGDCTSCHTREGHEPFAGGVPVNTNFGAIYGANLTPDRETGLGAWSPDQFYRALHMGIRASGAHLYPAFPYTSFTRLTRADSDALYAYLRTLASVRYRPPPPRLPPIVNIRAVMTLWNALFFKPGEYRPTSNRSAQWNRGAYLVTGIAHCDACHTPRNFLGAERNNEPLRGNRLENWHAANLASNRGAGLGGWSDQEITDYLRNGRNVHAAASGMMEQVVVNSTSHLSDEDRQAIVVYLRSLAPAPQSAARPSVADNALGAHVFADNCSACHGPNAEGVTNMFPRLASDSSLQARDPTTLARIVLEGTRAPMTEEHPTPSAMPAFGWKLNDAEIAAVLTYLRSSHDNSAAPVSASDVGRVRRAIARSP
jgi:mono/diheme cytochrome c family protein